MRAANLYALVLLPLSAVQSPASDLQAVPPTERVHTEIPYRDGTVSLVSDFQERISKTTYRAKGHVEITYQDMVMSCEELEYDEVTREGFTRGPTRFSQNKQWLSCSRAEFNFANKTGVFYDASGYTDQEFMITGRTIIKTGADTYRIEGAFISACEGKRPKWSFLSSKASLTVDKTARLHQVRFKIKGIPVLYFPYVILPMEKKTRSSGFMPFHIGSSTTKGNVFSVGYFQTLGPSYDATFYGEYFSERGIGIGGIFRARPNPQTHLEVSVFGINDKLGQGGAHVVADGESLLKYDFRAVARVNISTSFEFRQAFSDTFRSATIPQENSALFLTRNAGSFSTNFAFQRDETHFPDRDLVVRKFPSLEFFSLGTPVAKTPLIFYLRASVDSMNRSDAIMQTPSMVQRLDLFPRFGLRLPALAGFSIVPTIGFRETYYSDRTSGGAQPVLETQSLHRQYTQFEIDLRTPTLERNFHTSWLGDFKHVIEPTVKYRRIHGIDSLDQTLRFDEEDAIADTNELEYGLVNRIFRKRENSAGSKQEFEFFSLSVAQKYYFDPTFGGAFKPGEPNMFYPLDTLTGFSLSGIPHTFAPTSIVARLTPRPSISYDARADLDSKLQALRDASLSVYWQQGKVTLAGTYFKTEDLEPGTFRSNQVQAQLGYGSPLHGFSGSITLSYNIQTRDLLNSHARLNYMWDCCGVSFEFQQFDLGSRTESRLNFSFTLRGIGSFGNIKRPESLF
jgi:LPS-assembly protein